MGISQDDILKAFDAIYAMAIQGIPNVSAPIEQVAADYMNHNTDMKKAVKEMHGYQIVKCTTSGFVTGFGGLITMPIAIPANVSSVLYMQMRMIASTACMAGYDIHSEQVRTLIYACLAGVSVGDIFKKLGVALGEKITVRAVEKIPTKVLISINRRIGLKFATRLGEKGLINVAKMIPIAGAVINGGYDCAETSIIANRAYRQFVEGDFSGTDKDKPDIIDIDPEDFQDIT